MTWVFSVKLHLECEFMISIKFLLYILLEFFLLFLWLLVFRICLRLEFDKNISSCIPLSITADLICDRMAFPFLHYISLGYCTFRCGSYYYRHVDFLFNYMNMEFNCCSFFCKADNGRQSLLTIFQNCIKTLKSRWFFFIKRLGWIKFLI